MSDTHVESKYFPDHLHHQHVRDAIGDDVWQDAVDDGEVRMMMATHIDPGCPEYDVDIDFGEITNNEDGDFVCEITASIKGREIYHREYIVDGEYSIWDKENL